MTTSTIYLNGQYLPQDEAQISVMDRGFLFGDGVYEVVPVYSRRPFRLAEHLQRLAQSLDGIRIANPLPNESWREIIATLIERNTGEDQSVYLQVTRGADTKRDHAFPAAATPSVFLMTAPLAQPTLATLSEGTTAITVTDSRWLHCNIKAITLLPNVLLRQEAVDSGCGEAIMIRDSLATEGAASNLFVVQNGKIATPPKGPNILPGITRDLTVELAQAHGLPIEERAISEPELRTADEIWLTSSTKEIIPVIKLDDKPVGRGSAGAVWQEIIGHYQAYKAQLRHST